MKRLYGRDDKRIAEIMNISLTQVYSRIQKLGNVGVKGMKHIVVTPTLNQRKPLPESWNEEDTKLLLELICLHGHDYRKVADQMEGKTPFGIKRKIE